MLIHLTGVATISGLSPDQSLYRFAHLPWASIRQEPDTLQADWSFHGRHPCPVSLPSFQRKETTQVWDEERLDSFPSQ